MLTKDDDGNVDGAKDAELIGLLEETVLALGVVVYKGGGGSRRVLSECQEDERKNRTDL